MTVANVMNGSHGTYANVIHVHMSSNINKCSFGNVYTGVCSLWTVYQCIKVVVILPAVVKKMDAQKWTQLSNKRWTLAKNDY